MSGGKFKPGAFYKHKNDCCDFIEVIGIYHDNGTRADLFVSIYTQDSKGWRKLLTAAPINVSKAHYDKWESYLPRGALRETRDL